MFGFESHGYAAVESPVGEAFSVSMIELQLALAAALERWIAPMHCTIGLFSDPAVLPNIVLFI